MALGDYDDERGRDQMDREHWADLDGSPVRQPDETATVHAARVLCESWDRLWDEHTTRVLQSQRAPGRHPSDTDAAYAARLQMWLWNRQQRSLR
jgi:hypothetical protein